jgi:hypothetical protein
MKRSPWLLFLVVAALAGGAFYGFYKLLELRFESGDVYPPSSSLRTDPLGTKVLYDALANVPGFTVSRNYKTLDKIANPGGATIFYGGTSSAPVDQDDVDDFNLLVKGGARFVVTMEPEASPTPENNGPAKPKKNAPRSHKESQTKAKKGSETDDDEAVQRVDFKTLMNSWGAGVEYRKSQKDTEEDLSAVAVQPNLERALTWHTALYFTHLSRDWRVLYNCEGQPALMERSMGHGSIVLAADSYFMSNEAMRKERAPLLLATLLGANTRVIFDESHLGVNEEPGIATLVRKYNLGGLVAALAVLAGLFVWQTSSSFLPALPDQEDAEIVTGKDSAAGFVSLLRRGIPPARLIAVCMEQWKQSSAHRRGKWAKTISNMESASLNGSRAPVTTYQSISQILAEKK